MELIEVKGWQHSWGRIYAKIVYQPVSRNYARLGVDEKGGLAE
jgi:hypothetical protein